MDGGVDGWMNGWMDGWVGVCVCVYVCVGGWMVKCCGAQRGPAEGTHRILIYETL